MSAGLRDAYHAAPQGSIQSRGNHHMKDDPNYRVAPEVSLCSWAGAALTSAGLWLLIFNVARRFL